MPFPTFKLPVKTLKRPAAAPVVAVMLPEVAVAKANVPDVTETVADDKPVELIEPEVEVKLNAPVVMVKPFEAVRVEENLPVPVTSRV